MAKQPKIVNETIELWNEFNSSDRETWMRQARSDQAFRLGAQWTQAQKEKLEAKEAAPITVNRIHKAIETMKAMLTSNRPGFKVAPQNDSDAKTANALQGLIQYIWQLSHGDEQVSRAIDNMLACSVGYLLAYIDPFSDDGMGDVKFKSIEPAFVYVDPNAQESDFSDASDIIISRIYRKDQAKRIYPQYKNVIKNATGIEMSDEINIDTQPTEYSIKFVGGIINIEGQDKEEIRGYERYSKVLVNRYRVREIFNKSENIYDDDSFKEYLETPVYVINGNPIREAEAARKTMAPLMEEYTAAMQQYQEMMQQIQMSGQQIDPSQLPPPPEEPTFETVTNKRLLDEGMIEVIKIMVPRIKMTVVIGDKHLYTRTMEMTDYPIIPLCNIHTGTPYPISEVTMVKDSQKYLNWLRSLVIRHSQISTNLKVIVPTGGNDIDELREAWDSTNAIIEVDMTEGTPILAQPLPMPSELFVSEDRAKAEIDDQMGIYDVQAGNPSNAPDSYRGILTMDEFGQRRSRIKLSIVERAMTRLGKVIYDFIREFYSAEKEIRILEPNHTYTEYVINKPNYTQQYEDDYSSPIEVLNDVSTGKYDVLFIPGSTLPDNRYAKFQLLLDAYKAELVDRVEVLKKSDIFDIDGVLSRIDTITNLEQQLGQMEQEIKGLRGDLQTREREIFHTKMDNEIVKQREKIRDEVSKHLLSLKESDLTSEKAVQLFEQRLNDILSNVRNEANLEMDRQALNQEKSAKAEK